MYKRRSATANDLAGPKPKAAATPTRRGHLRALSYEEGRRALSPKKARSNASMGNEATSGVSYEQLEDIARGPAYGTDDPETAETLQDLRDQGFAAPEVIELGDFNMTLFPAQGDKPPVLAFGGTDLADPGDVLADASGFGVGYPQFADNYDAIKAALDKLTKESGGQKVVLTGHSLGGATAQTTAAYLPEYVAQVDTYNSPGVNEETVERLEAHNASVPEDERINSTHFAAEADVISLAGERHTPGSVFIVDTDSPLWTHSDDMQISQEDLATMEGITPLTTVQYDDVKDALHVETVRKTFSWLVPTTWVNDGMADYSLRQAMHPEESKFTSALKSIGSTIWSRVSPIGEGIGDLVVGTGKLITKAGHTIWEGGKRVVAGTGKLLGAAKSKIGGLLSSGGRKAKGALGWLRKKASGVLGSARDASRTVSEGARHIADAARAKLQSAWDTTRQAASRMKTVVAERLSGAMDALDAIGASVSSALRRGAHVTRDKLGSALSWLREKGTATINGARRIGNATRSLVSAAGTKAKAGASKVVSKVSGAASRAAGAVQAGIAKAAGWLSSRVKGSPSTATQAADAAPQKKTAPQAPVKRAPKPTAPASAKPAPAPEPAASQEPTKKPGIVSRALSGAKAGLSKLFGG